MCSAQYPSSSCSLCTECGGESWCHGTSCKTKSHNIDLITTFPNAHQEVIWLDVMMYEVAKYKPGTAPASLKQPSMAYQSK